MKILTSLLALFLTFFTVQGNQLKIEILVKPQIDSRTEKVVFIPSKDTPKEFIAYLSEKIKEHSGLKVIDQTDFSKFLNEKGLTETNATPENLILLYKKFGFLSLVFVDFANISVKTEKACKTGNLSFSVSVFHVRDGTVLRKREINLNAEICQKTAPPNTADIVKILFDKSVVEILKLFTPWSFSLNLPLFNNSLKHKKACSEIEKGYLKKAYNLLNKKEKKDFEDYVLLGNILLLKQKFDKATLFYEKALSIKNDERISEIYEKLNKAGISNLLKAKIVKEKEKKTKIAPSPKGEPDLYSPFNKGDLLLKKLQHLEEKYKNGEISEQEYMDKKYKLIEQF